MNDVEEICKKALNYLNNSSTKIVVDDNIKSSYYFWLSDKIYISKKQTHGSEEQRIIVLCHECIHSIQNKTIQCINFVLSNVEIFMFVLLVIFRLTTSVNLNTYINIYIVVAILAIIIRYYLEIGAIIGSIKLANKCDSEFSRKFSVSSIKRKMLKTLPALIISLFGIKLLRIVIILLIRKV